MIQCPHCFSTVPVRKLVKGVDLWPKEIVWGSVISGDYYCADCRLLFNATNKNLYSDTVKVWGVENQISQAMEECAELIVALNHYRRMGCKANGAWEGVCGEIADVQIMIEQMKVILGGNCEAKIEIVKALKLRSIEKMLEGK